MRRKISCFLTGLFTVLFWATLASAEIIFVGESHGGATRPITDTAVFDQLDKSRHRVLLTEFIWPRWQKDLNAVLSESMSFEDFISKNVNGSRFDEKVFSSHVLEFLVWAKNSSLPVIGIDENDFGLNIPKDNLPKAPPEVLKRISEKFKVSDLVIEDVSHRDLQMADRILESYNSLSHDTQIVVYLGSMHAERIPTLLRNKIPLNQMSVIHLGTAMSGKKDEVQLELQQTECAPHTTYLAPQEDLERWLHLAQATQALIAESAVWDR